jgi:hypothetical protein
LSNWEYLYERSLGCVGILKNWSKNAFADAIDEGASTVTLKHLERRALSVGQCRNILNKIQEGERRYAEIEGEVEKLREELGLGIKPTSKKNSQSKASQGSQKKATKLRGCNRGVGQCNPKRDQVGVEKNAG